ncbi:uncharacterized protein EURHEDRAFT_446312 [Aspergillus ruber CBS 135680]|uniref:Ell binding protein Ebp1 C-terminal domain-containing protein n=1 Tax=Aspergillus ruber (strain CBS 135680) TaxID=1388766 RepID=A0A017SRJ4_ASPRC|nr:uncharacterized protein EURHEDRAFT_446312 [Aspergillus ruber CBS 135680]EYE99553.1 hypothetical protein EURHEDRAFT_446312 [Aspergillus ruber CBS 135680]
MAVDRPSPSTDNNFKNSKSAHERTFASDQESIDQRLKHLKDEVLPFYPFLLTIPTNVPFRLGNHFINNWAVGDDGPFTLEEQQLQYMTFLTHHEGDSLLVAVGDWSDGTGSIMPDQRSRSQSAASTPSSGPAKKKISLTDYKNKWKSGASAPPVTQEAISQSVSTFHAFDDKPRAPKPGPPRQNTHKHPNSTTLSKSSSRPAFENTSRKRPPDFEREHSKSNDGRPPSICSPKKPRLSPDRSVDDRPDRSKSNRLPDLLSPTLPPTSDSPGLPQLLSPTLPPSIEKELASIHDESLAHGASQKGSLPNFDKLTEDAARMSSNLNVLPLDSTQSPSLQRVQSRSPAAAPIKRQLIVKLRYGRANKKRVEALLKFSGKRKTVASCSPTKKEDHNVSKVPLSDDIAVMFHRPEKKVKHVPSDFVLEKPQTPMSISRPQGKHKATPIKEPKITSSRHMESTISEGKTPLTQGSKDPAGDSTVRLSPPQANNQPSHSRSYERRAWKEEYQKYGNLGRELKHAVERHTAKESATASDKKVAAATALEAILCFILAFVADDQSKALARQIGDSSAWVSILAYWNVVKKISAPYPQLHSLCSILGAVSYDAIHALDLDRLAVSPLPGEHTPAPSEESKKNLKELLELKTRLPKNHKESRRLWAEGMRGLSEDVLEREFPETWQNRSRRYSERGKQPLTPGDYSGGFFLPLGRTDTPLQIVRFGWSILNEWCAKEGLHWRSRLDF